MSIPGLKLLGFPALVYGGVFLLVLTLSSRTAFSQPDIPRFSPDTLSLIEKVHLHLDKPYYAAGQTIWFKAYVVDAGNRPSMQSKVLYVELIDSENRIRRQLKLPLAVGLASGDIALPDTLSPGNYRLRAYTQWMRNFGEDSFFDQVVSVVNPLADNIIARSSYRYLSGDQVEMTLSYGTIEGNALKEMELKYEVLLEGKRIGSGKGITDQEGKFSFIFTHEDDEQRGGTVLTTLNYQDREITKSLPFRHTAAEISVRFFPEGGYLVDSIRSRVAFKAVGPDGRGAMVSGYVVDSQDTRVAEFRSEHAGMGSFMLTPFGGTYTAVILTSQGEKRIPLPASKPSGYVLTLTGEDEDHLFLRVAVNASGFHGQHISLVAESRSYASGMATFRMKAPYIDVSFSKETLQAGVNRLTLLDENNIPVAERLLFTGMEDQLELELTSNRKKYDNREKVGMALSALEPGRSPVVGSFSVAVTDISRVPVNSASEHTILTDLLLESELRGYIEDANYYFSGRDSLRKRHLHNLLLTQGWRMLSFNGIHGRGEGVFPAERGITISGRVTLRGKPVQGGSVLLLSPGKAIQVEGTTDSAGRFSFEELVFADSARFVIQARQEKDRANVEIHIDEIVDQEVSVVPYIADVQENINAELQPYLKDSREELSELIRQGVLERSIVLDEVVVRAVKNPTGQLQSSRLGAAPADFVLTPEMFSDHTNLGLAIHAKAPGLTVKYSPKETIATLQRAGGKMSLFVDGVYREHDLNMVDINEVAMIEIIRNSARGAIYGDKGSHGVIAVTTKMFAGMPLTPTVEPEGIRAFAVKGYTLMREFYSPDYDHPDTKRDIQDLRTTVYWNPDLFISKGETLHFDFFTADKPGRYRAVVEGLDYRGKLGRSVYIFEVGQ